jgi:hypothetical protein
MPEEESNSPWAAEGTCAHELAEAALIQEKDCKEFIGQTFEGHEVDEEMAEYVQIYVDYAKEAARGEFKEVSIEERFDLSFIRPGMFGSNDLCVSEFMGTLEVIDLKYGKGVEVQAKDNKQLMYYALGAAHGQDFEQVKLTIIQPRVANPIKSWTISMDRLEQFADELARAYDATLEDNAPLQTGSHCRFCRAKAICSAKREQVAEVAKVDFQAAEPIRETSLPEVGGMDTETIAKVLKHSKEIKSWLDSVEAYAFNKAESGIKIPGKKLVKKRAIRKVANPKEVIRDFSKQYGEELYGEKKLLTVGKLEKLIGKSELKDYLIAPDNGNTLVDESDKRPEVQPGLLTDFSETPLEESNIDNFDNLTF